MKQLILFLVVVAIAAPCRAFAIEEFKRTGEIETDKSGGYSESQRDPHARRAKQIKDKTGGGYYQGEYHNTSPEYRPGEWQFVDPSSGGGKSQPKKYKKVKETDKPKKSTASKDAGKKSGTAEKAKAKEPAKEKAPETSKKKVEESD